MKRGAVSETGLNSLEIMLTNPDFLLLNPCTIRSFFRLDSTALHSFITINNHSLSVWNFKCVLYQRRLKSLILHIRTNLLKGSCFPLWAISTLFLAIGLPQMTKEVLALGLLSLVHPVAQLRLPICLLAPSGSWRKLEEVLNICPWFRSAVLFN